MNPWSLLPNAHLIDWVLASLKFNPDIWDRAWEADRASIRGEAWRAARNAARGAVYDATWTAVYDATHGAALNAAWTAILALIAHDDSDQYLNMTYEQLSVYAALSDKPQALLLLPLKWAQEHEPNQVCQTQTET